MDSDEDIVEVDDVTSPGQCGRPELWGRIHLVRHGDHRPQS